MESVEKSFPNIERLIAFDERLLDGIKQFCFDQKAHHLQKRIERGQ